MTDLQTSLMAVGGIIVVAVVSYNKWQEHKEKKSVDRAFSETPEHAAPARSGGGARAEPSFGIPPSDQDTETALPASAVAGSAFAIDTDSVDAASMPVSAAVYRAAEEADLPKNDLPVDALVDCVIPLSLGSNLRGEKIIGPIQSLRHVGNKPVNFVGQREDGSWEAIQHGVVYSALLAGIQLANRTSALNEIEFSELVTRLRQVADELDAEPDIPNMMSVMTSARALHQFVGLYDAQLGVNLKANGAPWSIATLLSALERQGFDVRPDGRLVMSDGEGGNLFSLSTNVTLAVESTTRLTLLLDVPCVAPDRDGFGAMIACARSLSHRLDGQVVDDTDQPLSDAGLAEIGGQVQTFYHDMQAADIPAGSIRALRLFS